MPSSLEIAERRLRRLTDADQGDEARDVFSRTANLPDQQRVNWANEILAGIDGAYRSSPIAEEIVKQIRTTLENIKNDIITATQCPEPSPPVQPTAVPSLAASNSTNVEGASDKMDIDPAEPAANVAVKTPPLGNGTHAMAGDGDGFDYAARQFAVTLSLVIERLLERGRPEPGEREHK